MLYLYFLGLLMTTESSIEVQTGDNPQFSVIWLHGLGAGGSDFEPVVPYLGLNSAISVRFVFPNAPQIPVTCNGGFVMPAWYDIISLSPNSREIDDAGLLESRERVRSLIATEYKHGIPPNRVFVAGFSQGGAVAYLAGLSHSESLAGILALSTYMPNPDQVKSQATMAGKQTPLLIMHGLYDDVVSLRLGEIARDTVESMGCVFDWHTFPIGHEVCMPEILAIGEWLNRRIAELLK